MVQQLGIVTKEPTAARFIAPENGVLFVVDLDPVVTLPLLGTIVDMQDMLVLACLSLDQRSTRHADLLITLQALFEGDIKSKAFSKNGGILEGLRSTLCQVRKHWITAIAQQNGLARMMNPAGKAG